MTIINKTNKNNNTNSYNNRKGEFYGISKKEIR